MTRPRRPRKRVDDDPELFAALETGAECAYTFARWSRLVGIKYFGDEPDLPKEYVQTLLDRWRPEHERDTPSPSSRGTL